MWCCGLLICFYFDTLARDSKCFVTHSYSARPAMIRESEVRGPSTKTDVNERLGVFGNPCFIPIVEKLAHHPTSLLDAVAICSKLF